MNVHRLAAAPDPALAEALAHFETQFTYPLGPGRFFRISHGDDYPRFFRAMGEAACFVAERDGQVLGVLGAALRRMILPSGDAMPVVYFGDLKIDHAARGGRALLYMKEAVQGWLAGRASAAYSVVMDGTPVTPVRYSGRLGIPPFEELGKIAVLRLPTRSGDETDARWQTDDAAGSACHARLSAGRHASAGGDARERSASEPIWLCDPHGRACGRLEDTRRAKRLSADDGVEMISAHLSRFACSNLEAGVALLRVAQRLAARRSFPALFVAIAAAESPAYCQALGEPDVVMAPATVFGCGLPTEATWEIDTAEI